VNLFGFSQIKPNEQANQTELTDSIIIIIVILNLLLFIFIHLKSVVLVIDNCRNNYSLILYLLILLI